MNSSDASKKIADVPTHSLDQLIYHRKEIRTVVVSRGKSCQCTFVLNNLCVVSVPEFLQYKYKIFRVELLGFVSSVILTYI